jgi:hypothetical protein
MFIGNPRTNVSEVNGSPLDKFVPRCQMVLVTLWQVVNGCQSVLTTTVWQIPVSASATFPIAHVYQRIANTSEFWPGVLVNLGNSWQITLNNFKRNASAPKQRKGQPFCNASEL